MKNNEFIMMNIISNPREFNDKEYQEFCDFIYKNAGINLTEKKKNLVFNRLRKRVIENNYNSFYEYFSFVKTNIKSEEYVIMINSITTNVSSFFRSNNQFNLLINDVFPKLIASGKKGIRIWSAGCSTGEEPYTICMVLMNKFPLVQFDILATDLSTYVLNKAIEGVYDSNSISQIIEPIYVKKYFTTTEEKYKIKPELKTKINFKIHNLITDPYPKNIDIIFCRNVIIYFDQPTKDYIFDQFYKSFNKDGYLFLGHSESLFNNRMFKYYSPSTYVKVNY